MLFYNLLFSLIFAAIFLCQHTQGIWAVFNNVLFYWHTIIYLTLLKDIWMESGVSFLQIILQ